MPIDKDFNDAAWRTIPDFVCAAAKGELGALQKSLTEGMKIDAQNINGTTALIAAVRENKDEAVHFLLDHGADIHIRDRAGWSALDYAATQGQLARVRELITSGADVNGKNDCDAAFLRETGGKTRTGLNLGATALMQAAREGHAETVQALIEAGADVNAKNKWGDTVLSKAAEGPWCAVAGNTAVVKLLLDAGANPDTEDTKGWTPLMQAAWHGFADVTALLLTKADPAKAPAAKDGWQGFTDTPSKTPAFDNALLLAAVNGSAATAKLLLDHGANVNVRQSAHGGSALYWASMAGHTDVVRLLLDRGADNSIGNFSRLTPDGVAKTPEIRQMILGLPETPPATPVPPKPAGPAEGPRPQ